MIDYTAFELASFGAVLLVISVLILRLAHLRNGRPRTALICVFGSMGLMVLLLSAHTWTDRFRPELSRVVHIASIGVSAVVVVLLCWFFYETVQRNTYKG